MINKMVSGGGSGKAKVDEATGSIKLGKNAGTTLSSDDDDNIAIGTDALNSVTTDCNNNIAIGTSAATALTTGYDNVCIGKEAGKALTDNFQNVAIGTQALTIASTGESRNVAIGTWSMINQNNAGCDYNVAVGYGTLMGNADANSYNTALGYNALNNTTGTHVHNVGIGSNALTGAGDKNGNVAIGSSAGQTVTTGDFNVIIGSNNSMGPTTGSRNILLGYNADAGLDGVTTLDNQIRIGSGGGFKSYSQRLTLEDFTGVGDNKAATTALCKFPQYGFVKRITCTVYQASGGTGEYNIALGTASGEGPGDTVTGAVELIGSGSTRDSNFTGGILRTQAEDTDEAHVDIITAKQTHIWEADMTVNASIGWMTADMYLYICHANASNVDDDSNTVVVITAEWFGID